MTKYVYHRKSLHFHGNHLYSLNDLKDIYPEDYNLALEKYKGREDQINQPIPGFNTTWNNVIHTSPINPLKVKEALIKAGRKPENVKSSIWFKIPTDRFKNCKVIWYKYSEKFLNQSNRLDIDDFEQFSFEKYQEMTEIPKKTFEYYQIKIKKGEAPLLFHLIPHILIESPLDIKDLEIIEVS